MSTDQTTVRYHSLHWQKWWQDHDKLEDLEVVRCAACNHLALYIGKIPLNSKDMLELDAGGTLDQRTAEFAPRPDERTELEAKRLGEAMTTTEDEGTITGLRVVPSEDQPAPMQAKANHPTAREAAPRMAETNDMAGGASFKITVNYRRSVSDGNYGSIAMGATVEETFPGEATSQAVAEVIESQAIIVKQRVLTELGLPFTQDAESLMIQETFAGTTVVGQGGTRALGETATEDAQARQAIVEAIASTAPEPAPVPATAPPAGRVARAAAPAPAAVTGPAGTPGRQVGAGRAYQGTDKSAEWMWSDLVNNPHRWYYRKSKRVETLPDFTSLDFKNGQGDRWLGLWLNDSRSGQLNVPDDCIDLLNELPDSDFSATEPPRIS